MGGLVERVRKIVLSLLFLGFSHNIVALDWFKFPAKNILKISTGAVVGGAGAVLSGFSTPLIALSAVVGSWVNSEWQSNNQLLKELSVANENLNTALKNTQETEAIQANFRQELITTSAAHQNTNRAVADVSRNLTQVAEHLDICKSASATYQSKFDGLQDHLAIINGKVFEVNRDLLSAAESQKEYRRKFQNFVMQSRMRAAGFSFGMALQYRQLQRIIKQQDELNASLQNNSNLLSSVAAKDESSVARYSDLATQTALMQQNLDQNLIKQKKLEQALAQILAAGDNSSLIDVFKMGRATYVGNALLSSLAQAQIPKVEKK